LFATTPEDRNDRYAQYHDQVRCTFRKFREMLDQLKAAGMFDDAVILVHGDHGSRIGRWASLGVDSKEAQTPQSRLDTYSTLFAVRAPWIEGGYDPGHSSLPDLVREFALGGLAGPGAASACREAAGGC
jgi:arylsulfatase A-like enzyme